MKTIKLINEKNIKRKIKQRHFVKERFKEEEKTTKNASTQQYLWSIETVRYAIGKVMYTRLRSQRGQLTQKQT